MENQSQKVTFSIADEVTYLHLVGLLESEKVWFLARKTGSSLYPSVNILNVYGEISVQEEDSYLLRNFLDAITNE
ncbi:MAG: hypothetical protein SFU27_05995 [Thermonemataceae bacterium]|nr:hypothetical protein [Thermonemataceae bacterium]